MDESNYQIIELNEAIHFPYENYVGSVNLDRRQSSSNRIQNDEQK